MSRLSLVLIVPLLLLGCGKTMPTDDDSPGGSSTPSTRKSGRPDDTVRRGAVDDEPNKKQSGPVLTPLEKQRLEKQKREKQRAENPTAFGEWSQVGEVRVKVFRAAVIKPTIVGGLGRETEFEGPDVVLLLWVQVENLSRV